MVRSGLAWCSLCVLLLSCRAPSEGRPDGSVSAVVDAAKELEFGAISGQCGVLDQELGSAAPSLFRVSIAFPRYFARQDQALLSSGARQILGEGNAGGSSVLSEVFAFDILQRCEEAELLKTETEITYDQEGKLTDFLAELRASKIGVSVTRAVGFPFDAPYTSRQAEDLLNGKLADILVSSRNVSESDRWQKQLLAILAYGPDHADRLAWAYAELDARVLADTLVYVIVTDGPDDFIYCDGACD